MGIFDRISVRAKLWVLGASLIGIAYLYRWLMPPES